ncbi:l1 transposable element-related [Holotrichia oblita]|uniref:L1 transposable element-related n=1 Tax=Holotrichia oblita TaxID=644536 RepID=A0ACB9TRA9_HOLOL|nr:l1 transposable element-related [Holotrichia oblita]
MDSLEQYTRRNSIRLFGVPEQENEDTLKLVKEILTEKMELPEICFLIDRCHRLKSKNASKNIATNARPNAIIIKFMSYNAKMSVNQQKKALKGTGWVITDDLTSNRYALYRVF